MRQENFYVYVGFRPDGSPCYVGKGSGRRWYKHGRQSHNRPLQAIIRRAGGEIPIVVIKDGLTESDAFKLEAIFIKAIGRFPVGPLVNMTDGGEGVSGHIHSAETRARMAIAATGQSSTKGVPKSAAHRAAAKCRQNRPTPDAGNDRSQNCATTRTPPSAGCGHQG